MRFKLSCERDGDGFETITSRDGCATIEIHSYYKMKSFLTICLLLNNLLAMQTK